MRMRSPSSCPAWTHRRARPLRRAARCLRGVARGAVLALGLLVLFGPGAGRAEAQSSSASRTEVTDVRFEGNETFPDDSLARAIVTRDTECTSTVLTPFCWFGADFAKSRAYLQRRELPRDLLRLRIWYQRRGFRETQVDTATTVADDGSVQVTFHVDEGRPVVVDSIVFFGAEEFEGTDLLDDLPLQRGDRLSTLRLDATRDTIVHRLANRGYAHAEALRSWFIPTDSYDAEVTYDIAPGVRARYGHVSVEGNEELSEFTVLRTLQFRAGDTYRESQVQDAQARLFGLEIIRNAQVRPDLEARPDSIIPVEVTVAEGDLRRVRGGAGWTSAECLNVEGRWVHRNFAGGARRLQVRGRVANVLASDFRDVLCPQSGDGVFGDPTWLASVELNQPWIFSTRNSLQASIFAERQSLPDVFVREAVGVSLAVTRAIGPRTPLTASYRPELSRLDAAEFYFCTSFLVCRPEDVDALQGANWLAPVGLNFNRATTNNVLNPSRGYTTLLDVEHAAPWTGSDFRYDRAVAEGSAYTRPTGGGLILAVRGRVGWVGAGAFEDLLGTRDDAPDIVHPQKRFYAGGANSVRGYSQNRLGPRVLTLPPRDVGALLSSEGAGCLPLDVILLECDATGVDEDLFLPRPTGGVGVVEGNVEFRLPVGSGIQLAWFADFGRIWQGGDIRSPGFDVTPGAGFRYMSPIGPLRLDLAYRFRGGNRLQVVTNQIRPFDPALDDPDDRLTVDGNAIPYVRLEELAVLRPLVLYGDSPAGSLSRFQLHLSLGQAF